MPGLIEKIEKKDAAVGVIGLGYVGLPLVREFLRAGFRVTGFDIDRAKIDTLLSGGCYIKSISPDFVKEFVKGGRFTPTADFSLLAGADAVLLCVPTPIGKHREPDLSYVVDTTKVVAKHLRKGQLIVLESTTYPGTTREEMLPVLEATGLKAGTDFHLAYSPERENPGDRAFSTGSIPKVVAGYTPKCLEAAKALYDKIVKTVPVSSLEVAEAAKILENTYRAVNIALVNELKLIFERMGIDVWEVIEAAKTKPFGFQAFYPGPGLGGHCIPIDPFYLTWKAKEYDFNTRFIELAGEINTAMPEFVVSRTQEALNGKGKSLKGSRILVLGVAYKKDVDDTRESPALRIIDLLRAEGALVDYSDPFIPLLPKTRKYAFDMKSASLTEGNLSSYDCAVLVTDHSDFDYEAIHGHTGLIIDTRNAFGSRGLSSEKVVRS